MSKKRKIVEELLKRNCLISPDSYEVLEDIDDDTLDLDALADALKDELVVTAEKLQEAITTYEEVLSEGSIDQEKNLVDEVEKQLEAILPKVEKALAREIATEHSSSAGKEKLQPTTDTSVSIKKPSKRKQPEAFKKFNPIGKKVSTELRVLQESSETTTVEGLIDDFQTYFNSRFRQLSSILRQRGDVTSSISIGELEHAKLKPNEELSIIGMVTEKRSLKKGGMFLTIEDETGRLNVIISGRLQELVVKAGALLDDQVAAFFGTIYENRLILKDFVLPDIPLQRQTVSPKESLSVCMTSDLHIGSKEFLEDSFNNMIDFLHGRVDDPYQRKLASEVKYFIVCGDLVEGIGIYPKQEDDLVITDIYDQYKYTAKLFKKIPEWIHIIVVSGNHDACRLALPQPAIGKEYAPDLWSMPNVTMLSNPATVELHGKKFLLYHGNSFEDVSSLTPGLSMSEPNGAMLYTLRFRHLAPTFGRRSSLVPSPKDELVIEHIPDVYHTGHVHINSHTRYRGVDCINSGTFQAQTDYMVSKNIVPTPARVPIINLQTNKLNELIFLEEKEHKQ